MEPEGIIGGAIIVTILLIVGGIIYLVDPEGFKHSMDPPSDAQVEAWKDERLRHEAKKEWNRAVDKAIDDAKKQEYRNKGF